MEFKNDGFDHVEFVVEDIRKHAAMYEKLGFEKAGGGTVPARGRKAELYQQGRVRILLTQPDGSGKGADEESFKFLRNHGEGICVLALDVADARAAFEETVKRGARVALEPVRYETGDGQITRAEIWTPGDVRYAFVERKGPSSMDERALFDEGVVAERLVSPAPLHLKRIDHLTNNIDMGEMKKWVDYYKQIFGFKVSRHFDINTGRTGLTSDVVQSECGRIIVPINEATEPESQVQEFVERFEGAGVQHLALETTDILDTISEYRKRGMKFLAVPATYYEEIPKRVPQCKEDLKALEEQGIMVDGEREGYLLQLFTEELVGPFFFEFIQRKGDDGFGEGNFRALFEAIERDQIRRGVLKA